MNEEPKTKEERQDLYTYILSNIVIEDPVEIIKKCYAGRRIRIPGYRHHNKFIRVCNGRHAVDVEESIIVTLYKEGDAVEVLISYQLYHNEEMIHGSNFKLTYPYKEFNLLFR